MGAAGSARPRFVISRSRVQVPPPAPDTSTTSEATPDRRQALALRLALSKKVERCAPSGTSRCGDDQARDHQPSLDSVLPQPGHDADHRVARLERHSVLRPPFPEGKEHAGATICYANNTKTSKARWRSASLSGEVPTALWRVPRRAAHLTGLHPNSHAPLAFQTREHGVPGMDSLKHLRVTGMNQRPAEARMEVTVGLCEIRCEPRLQSPRERDDVVAPGVLEQVFQHHLYRLVP